MAKLAAIFLVVLLSQNIWAAPAQSKIQSSLINKAGRFDIRVSFVGGVGNLNSQFETRSFATNEARREAFISALQAHSTASQKEVVDFLDTQLVKKVMILWGTNQIGVYGADSLLVQTLAEFSQVSFIEENERIPLEGFEVEKVFEGRENGILAEWGVENIRATAVWAAAGGNTGEGVVICTIDTGVRGTHEALRNNHHGHWHDPYTGSGAPIDQNGHGTHTTGNICGSGGIGVAPGARWGACRGCDTSSCGTNELLACAQHSLSQCHLVSNSWGGGRGNTFYDQAILNFHSARVIPLFSNGNSGPSCNTANSPADSVSNVLGIGSTTSANALSSFSSKGPSIQGNIKPDISAPGSSITSSYHTSDTAYSVLSGTSMSCPHAAGAVALLLSKNRNLSYAEVKDFILRGAVTNLTPTGMNCGGINDSVYPNHSYGAGKVDALNSFNALLASMKQ